jgi:hypothetical protein
MGAGPIFRSGGESLNYFGQAITDPGAFDPEPGFDPSELESGRRPSKRRGPVIERPKGLPFATDLDLAELDDRGRISPAWSVRAKELSKSNLVLHSRRMTFPGRFLIAAVHRIDDHPVPLFGKVVSCVYDTDGMYRVDMDLLPVPDVRDVKVWLAQRAQTP